MTSLRIFILFISILFISCNNDNTQKTEPTPKKPINYLALGDSYTIGQSVAETKRFPVQLIDSLRGRDYLANDAKIIAQTGWRTDNLMNAIIAEELTDTFDIVSLLIGVNNQFQGRTVEQYRAPFRELLEKAIELTGGDATKVFVVSIPDYGVTPFGMTRNPEEIAEEIDEFNAANLEISDSLNVTYFNITPISRQAENNPDLIANDGLHPSGEMYRLWVKLMLDEVENMVR
ncbi:MAG: SGNH/GDSL hydrolase family protein [Saprospiraceae bacterium]